MSFQIGEKTVVKKKQAAKNATNMATFPGNCEYSKKESYSYVHTVIA